MFIHWTYSLLDFWQCCRVSQVCVSVCLCVWVYICVCVCWIYMCVTIDQCLASICSHLLSPISPCFSQEWHMVSSFLPFALTKPQRYRSWRDPSIPFLSLVVSLPLCVFAWPLQIAATPSWPTPFSHLLQESSGPWKECQKFWDTLVTPFPPLLLQKPWGPSWREVGTMWVKSPVLLYTICVCGESYLWTWSFNFICYRIL